jgi:hypothetical protein
MHSRQHANSLQHVHEALAQDMGSTADHHTHNSNLRTRFNHRLVLDHLINFERIHTSKSQQHCQHTARALRGVTSISSFFSSYSSGHVVDGPSMATMQMKRQQQR